METKNLFRISNEGYNCEDVEQYIAALKTEYKKVYEYAKAAGVNNEKLKKICLALSEENKNLKSAESSSVNADFVSDVENIVSLSEKISTESAALKAKLLK